MAVPYVFKPGLEDTAQCFLNDVAGDEGRRVKGTLLPAPARHLIIFNRHRAGFEPLAEPFQVGDGLLKNVAEDKDIFVLVEGGSVREIVNLPPNLNVTVIDYDIEGVEKERLEISPVDGELCTIDKW